MINLAVSQEIQSLIRTYISYNCTNVAEPPPIEAAIVQARTPEEVEMLARALIVRKRSMVGGFGLRAAPQIKRIAALLNA